MMIIIKRKNDCYLGYIKLGEVIIYAHEDSNLLVLFKVLNGKVEDGYCLL